MLFDYLEVAKRCVYIYIYIMGAVEHFIIVYGYQEYYIIMYIYWW